MMKCSNGQSWDHLLLRLYPRYLLLPIMLYKINQKTLALCITIFLFAFFRSPDRTPQLKGEGNVIHSPADGLVMKMDKDLNGNHVVCIYLSIADVHVQYSPADCTILAQRYKKGQFNIAYIMEKSQYNERLETDLLLENGDKLIVVQIAGQIAQRIVSFVKPGDVLSTGCRLGMIQFGSRVDIHIPKKYVLTVKEGDRVVAAQSPVAFSPIV
jgi:phosphatidylserine decarboxylase